MLTPNAEKLVEEYQKSTQDQQAQHEIAKKKTGEKAVKKFKEALPELLGENFLAEMQLDIPRVKFRNRGDSICADIEILFTLGDLKGRLEAVANGVARLEFYIDDFRGTGYNKRWERGIVPQNGRFDSLEMGELIAIAVETLAMHNQALSAQSEEEHQQLIKKLISKYRNIRPNCNNTLAELTAHHKQCLSKHPELKRDWDELYRSQREVFSEYVREQREKAKEKEILQSKEAAEERAREAERKRLNKQVQKLFRPFTVYKITYGAKPSACGCEEYNDEGFYTETTLALSAIPDDEGWFTLTEGRARLPNVIRVDEIKIIDPNIYQGLPSGSRAIQRELKSRKYSDMVVWYLALPKQGLAQ
ncbi:MAG: hypothetical protein OEZ02_00905 [Anaerolineae bacterium]|nr:hypothetical protein [Anaerolineae bacterium]